MTSILTPETILRRLPDLDLHVDSEGRVVIDVGTRRVVCGSEGLAVLAAFDRPRSMSEALDSLAAGVRGAQQWMDQTSTVLRLYRAGVLRDESQPLPPPLRPASSYGTAPAHVRMLDDRVRTESFLAAIRRVVRPGDVVVEIGTGTGILAVAAARAGAERVFAIEESPIAEAARSVFEANGVADRVTLVRGSSTEVNLPRRGDVLISVLIGNEPLAERLLETTRDAVARLLRPGARLIPSHLRVYALPLTVPPVRMMRQTFAAESLRRWRSWYGIDLEALATVGSGGPEYFFIDPVEARGWPRLSEPALLVEVDLGANRELAVDAASEVTVAEPGLLNGVLVYFEAELGCGVRLSTHPAEVAEGGLWRSPVWVPAGGVEVEKGDRLGLRYSYRASGRPEGVQVVPP